MTCRCGNRLDVGTVGECDVEDDAAVVFLVCFKERDRVKEV